MCDADRRWEEFDLPIAGYSRLERLDRSDQSSFGSHLGPGQSSQGHWSRVCGECTGYNEAEHQMLTGSTSTEEQNIALRRLEQGGGQGGKEIRVSSTSYRQIMNRSDGLAMLRDCKSSVTWLGAHSDMTSPKR